MFTPKYTITNYLLANIKKISSLVIELNNRKFPHVVLALFERKAREISAFASTSIEGNPLPLTEVKKILKSLPVNVRDSEREVLNYNKALEKLNSILKGRKAVFSIDLILSIQKKVVEKLVPEFDLGKFRKKPVFVNNPKKGKTVYFPPDDKDVKPLMRDLVEFVNRNREEVDPLILAGIFHKQFVIIHPFMDGNGRTARLTTKVLLFLMGLNTFNLFSFENYYNKNVTKYFENVGVLGNYYEIADKIDFTKWLKVDPFVNTVKR